MDSFGGSWMIGDRMKRVIDGDATVAAAARILTKDVGLALDLSQQLTFPLSLGSVAHQALLATLAMSCSSTWAYRYEPFIYLMGRDGEYLGFMPPRTSAERMIEMARPHPVPARSASARSQTAPHRPHDAGRQSTDTPSRPTRRRAAQAPRGRPAPRSEMSRRPCHPECRKSVLPP